MALLSSSSINLFPFQIARGGRRRNGLGLAAATRNMWSGMQPVAVRGILTGGGKERAGFEICMLGVVNLVFVNWLHLLARSDCIFSFAPGSLVLTHVGATKFEVLLMLCVLP